MPPTTPVLNVPSAWSRLEFISDIHLHEEDEATFQAWRSYMLTSTANAIFILGDFFEVWVGDDTLTHAPTGFEARCVDVLTQAAQRLPERPIYLMHGNRDFLMGDDLARAAHVQLVADPTVVQWNDERLLLTHGDALCTDDVPYQAFRSMVRSPAWQHDFLQRPYAERVDIAKSLRQQSQANKQAHAVYSEIDLPLAAQWLQTHACHTLIHGHTHNPSSTALGQGRLRHVLSDWVCQGHTVIKGDVLCVMQTEPVGLQVQRIALASLWPCATATLTPR
ncbi:UDP-2,3-diacylglucosamine diphosphatase [Curvibacter sp. CHRR-16]|uniref:UDP-2,3-diacylglucosamine diphosphatase n=1 Tax=Curvibacter sp. CHRR-16 TaxID=2835872 RepID=UPI001BDB0E1E|nr:UDP-2,3-diacylglucosamine diphosphatase [Curvibacter sp. CHRR-16]MBT0571097.1 UDP-2,3-diacylglucosamine diphosphatase [Curvibacter sp. CHRR-16]